MAVYAVVPVKNLAVTKRRLSTVFTPQERKTLTLAMLKDVLNALKVATIDQVVVVGEDSQVQELAEKFGASYLAANGASLNAAVEAAEAWCVTKGAGSVLVLPADVPLITSKDINCLLQLGNGGGSAVVLSPSQNWGTNALYQTPPNLIPACFGPKSFLNHIREAYQRGISVRLHFSYELATDVDSAEDLKKLFDIENSTVCSQVLGQMTRSSARVNKYFC